MSARRWWTYQRERFPLAAHGALILVLAASTLAYAVASRGASAPSWTAGLAAFVSAFLFFLQLRIADEHKDYEEDLAHRPYRPVPRGLVKLPELRVVGIAAALVQLALALVVDARLVLTLAAVWAYHSHMTKEFFVPAWLKARPALYMASHMLILPLILVHVAAFDLLPARAAWPPAFGAFLAMAYLGGVVAEVGRKMRAPEDEEPGVETYSAVWGRPRATLVWLAAMALASVAAALASGWLALVAPLAAIVAALALARAYVAAPRKGIGKRVELVSALWLLAAYASAGFLPLALGARP